MDTVSFRRMTDPRQERTRAALRDALIDLLTQKDFDAISVSALCREAGIARPTFYLHAKEKADILRDHVEHFLSAHEAAFAAATQGRRGIEARDALAPVFVEMLITIEREARLFRLVFGGRAGLELHERLLEHQRRLNRLYFATQDHRDLSPVELDLIASFCAGGVMHLVGQWLQPGTQLPVARVAQLVGQLLDGALRRAVTLPTPAPLT
jgi:AcrR family transcriptional regulator